MRFPYKSLARKNYKSQRISRFLYKSLARKNYKFKSLCVSHINPWLEKITSPNASVVFYINPWLEKITSPQSFSEIPGSKNLQVQTQKNSSAIFPSPKSYISFRSPRFPAFALWFPSFPGQLLVTMLLVAGGDVTCYSDHHPTTTKIL
jgi:hypothetical protein